MSWKKLKDLTNHLVEKDHKKVMTYILIIALLGVFLVLWSNTNRIVPGESLLVEKREGGSMGEDLEERLARNLSMIEGVGEVKVQIYYSSNPRYVFGEDRRYLEKATLEEDPQGTIKQIREETQDYQVVVMRDGSGGERPLMEEEIKPAITGVLIVAQGAEKSVIRDRLIRSVATLFDLPLHRIQVVSGKGGN